MQGREENKDQLDHKVSLDLQDNPDKEENLGLQDNVENLEKLVRSLVRLA